MPTGRLPLNYPIESRTASTLKDSRIVNALVEGGQIVKRPGLAILNNSPALPVGQAQGLFSWANFLVSVNNNTVSLLAGLSLTTPSGTNPLTGVITPISFSQSANDTYLVFHNGSNIYTIDNLTKTVTSPVSGTGVISATINNPGVYYSGVPTVTFSGGGGAPQATGTAVLFNNQVSGITINTPGTYTGLPSITLSTPPSGVAGTGSANMSGPFSGGEGGLSYDVVSSVTISNAGSGYTSAPPITFTPSGGTVFSASATGYTTINTAGNISSVVITNGGNYDPSYPPTVTIGLPPLGVMATATANMSNTIKGPYTPGLAYLNGTFYVFQSGTIVETTSNTATISITSPAVVTQVAHGLVAGTAVVFSTTGALPTGLTAGTTYYVLAPVSPDTYQLATTIRGTPINTSGTQSGIHTATSTYTTNGRIYGSNLEDPSAWSALNFVSTGSDPDSGVAIARHLNYIVAFGQWSTEFFYDNGNPWPGSPLSNYQSAKLEIGCANGYSVAQVEQSILWVGQYLTGGRSVYMLEGTSPIKVSTRYIDKYLNKDAMVNVKAFAMKISGHTLYILSLEDQNLSLVYDLDEKHWSEWTSLVGGVESYFTPTYFSSNVEYNSNLYLQDDQGGVIYTMSSDYYTDNGVGIQFRAVSPRQDSGTIKRKFYTSVEVVGDKANGTLSIRHSDNDYATWSGYRTVNLLDTRPILYQNGTARRRAWEVYSQDSIPIRLEALEMSFEIGEEGYGGA